MPQVGGMPYRKSGTYGFQWEPVAELLKKNPGVEVLADELVNVENVVSLRNSVRQGSVNSLRLMGGIVLCFIRNGVVDDEALGGRRGDLWFRWEPEGEQAGYYRQKFLDRDSRRNPVVRESA